MRKLTPKDPVNFPKNNLVSGEDFERFDLAVAELMKRAGSIGEIVKVVAPLHPRKFMYPSTVKKWLYQYTLPVRVAYILCDHFNNGEYSELPEIVPEDFHPWLSEFTGRE